MAVLDQDLTQSGLDALEVPLPHKTSRARKFWRATWPKLLATAIVFGLWEFLWLIEWKPRFAFPSPDEAVPVHLRQLRSALARGAHHARAWPLRVSDRARRRDDGRCACCADPGPPRRDRIHDHRSADDAVGCLVPRRGTGLQAERERDHLRRRPRRRAVHRQRPHQRDRQHPTGAVARRSRAGRAPVQLRSAT